MSAGSGVNAKSMKVVNVSVTVDVRLMRDPETCSRVRRLSSATLKPGEIIEVPVFMSEFQMYNVFWRGDPPVRQFVHMRDTSHVGDRWCDMTLHLSFRDSDGFIRSRSADFALEW